MKCLFASLLAFTAASLAYPGNPNDPRPSHFLSPADILAIRNTISTYATAVDSKDSTLLASLFTSSAVATFTTPDQTVVGGAAIAQHDLYAFTGLNTHHALSTQTLASNKNGTVNAVTYFDATIFGKDCYEGQIVTASGSYVDSLEKTNDTWVISGRDQIYANPEDPFIGEVAIVLGPACNSTS